MKISEHNISKENGSEYFVITFETLSDFDITYSEYLKIQVEIDNELYKIKNQRLEKYSERFDNDKSAIGNPETWGKRMVDEVPKQETLAEANWKVLGTKEDTFYIGAKWQQERSYSEEDIKSAFKVGFSIGYGSDVHAIDERNRTSEEWFEQFKNK
jgi:hypothetical protein